MRKMKYSVKLRSGLVRNTATKREAEALARAERKDGWPTKVVRLNTCKH